MQINFKKSSQSGQVVGRPDGFQIYQLINPTIGWTTEHPNPLTSYASLQNNTRILKCQEYNINFNGPILACGLIRRSFKI